MRAPFIAAFAAGLALTAPATGATVPDPDDALFLEVRLKQLVLGEGVRGYRQGEGACLILSDLLQTLDVPVELDATWGTARGWAFAESRTIEIDRKAGSVRISGKVVAGGAGAITDAPEGWCVDAQALSHWLGVTLAPDLSNALLVVKSEAKLPVELAAERRQRAAAASARSRPVAVASLPKVRLPYLM